MLIPEIPGICFDNIISSGFNRSIHFITHTLEQEIVSLPGDWSTEIYTSEFVYNIILSYRNNGPAKYFRKLKPGINLITLKNGKTLKIQYFVTSVISGNMMMALEYDNMKILYSGVFSCFHKLLANNDFTNFIKSDVNCLYIDNYYWRLGSSEPPIDTIVNMQQIIDLYPSSIFLVNVPLLGYEDLILDLVERVGVPVFISGLNLHLFKYLKMDELFEEIKENAKILIGRAVKSLDEIKEDFKHKIINIRIIDAYKNCFQNNLEYHRYGLYEVKWSPHATRIQLEKLIRVVKPKTTRCMYEVFNIDDGSTKSMNDLEMLGKSLVRHEALDNKVVSDTIVIDDSAKSESVLEISDTESSCRFILHSNSSGLDASRSDRDINAEQNKNLSNLESKLNQLNKTNKNTINSNNKIDEINKLNSSKDYKLLCNPAKRKLNKMQEPPNANHQENISKNVSGYVDLVKKLPKFKFNVNDKEIIYLDSDEEEE